MATEWVDALPAKLRIGAHDISIHKMGESWGKDTPGAMSFGDWSDARQTIRIRRQMRSKALAVDVILHEVFHAIYTLSGLRQNDGEERTVMVMASSLTQVLRDNPAFAKWLADMTSVRRRRK
jgi:hypothetical protein